MAKLSAALIVKNEEEVLRNCLDSMAGLWDELVVVDTGSTDGTVEIAREYGARIGHFEWVDDFALARNYAERLCTGDYIWWMDADEVLVAGKDLVRQIVDEGRRDGVRPQLIFTRDQSGRPVKTYVRQETLHKNNGEWKWIGAAHNWLSGPARDTETGIVIEHTARPSGDRPNHKNILAALRKNLGKGFNERDLFYLLRQHWYERNYQEAIALAERLLQQHPGWPIQRSHAAVIMGGCYYLLGDFTEARSAFLRAIKECGGWAEPYFSLGEMHYRNREWRDGVTWLLASTTVDAPAEYFADQSIYEWRRWDLLAVCLSKLGRNREAALYGAVALAARPEDKRLQKNQRWYEEHADA